MTPVLWFWIALGSIVLAGLFSSLYLSLREVARVALEARAQRSSPARQELVAHISGDLDAHAIAIALPRLLLTLASGIAWIGWVSELRGPALLWYDVAIGLAVATIAGWIAISVIPLSIAQHAAAGTICLWARLIRLAHTIAFPLRRVAAFLDEIVRRLAGEQGKQDVDSLEAELLSVVEEGEREGRFDESARDMIESVVQFRQTSVEEIMTPRTDILALVYTDDLAEICEFVRESSHSRIPVYEDDLDHIIGILYAKDLLNWLTAPANKSEGMQTSPTPEFNLRELLRDATYVPETKTVAELLNELIANRVHIAVAADEYGGTAGLVTIEDIIEEVFGDIADEYDDQAETPSVDIDPNGKAAELDARKHIDDANDALEGIGVELPENEDYDTVGGYVVVTLGHIPEVGAQLEQDGFRITVLEAEQTRVIRIRIECTDDASGVAAASSNAAGEQPDTNG